MAVVHLNPGDVVIVGQGLVLTVAVAADLEQEARQEDERWPVSKEDVNRAVEQAQWPEEKVKS